MYGDYASLVPVAALPRDPNSVEPIHVGLGGSADLPSAPISTMGHDKEAAATRQFTPEERARFYGGAAPPEPTPPTTDYGSYADLVPKDSAPAGRPVEAADYGSYAGMVPKPDHQAQDVENAQLNLGVNFAEAMALWRPQFDTSTPGQAAAGVMASVGGPSWQDVIAHGGGQPAGVLGGVVGAVQGAMQGAKGASDGYASPLGKIPPHWVPSTDPELVARGINDNPGIQQAAMNAVANGVTSGPRPAPGSPEWQQLPLLYRVFSKQATDQDRAELVARVDPLHWSSEEMDRLKTVDPKAFQMVDNARQAEIARPGFDGASFDASNQGEGLTPDQIAMGRIQAKAQNHARKLLAIQHLNNGDWAGGDINWGDAFAAMMDSSGAGFGLGATRAILTDVPNAVAHLVLSADGSFDNQTRDQWEHAVHDSPAAQFLPFLIPGAAPLIMASQLGGALADSAEARSFEPVLKMAQGFVSGVNVFDPGISVEERMTRTANALMMTLGAFHGAGEFSHDAAVREVATDLGGGEIPGGEQGQRIQEQAERMVSAGEAARDNFRGLEGQSRPVGGDGIDQRVEDAQRFGRQNEIQMDQARAGDVNQVQNLQLADLDAFKSRFPALVPPEEVPPSAGPAVPGMPTGPAPDPSAANFDVSARRAEQPFDFDAFGKQITDVHPSISDQMGRDVSQLWQNRADAYVQENPGTTTNDFMRQYGPVVEPGAVGGDLTQTGAGAAKGSVTFPAGFGVDPNAGKAVIKLFEHGDVSTLVHESAHIWRRTLSGENRSIVEKWLRVEPGADWTEAQEERFARATERYFMKGTEPPGRPELVPIFQRFKQWLRAIYHTVKVSPEMDVNIPADVRDVFDRMYDKETAQRPRNRALREVAKAREYLAGLAEDDPRLDHESPEFDEGLYHAVREQLGGPGAADRTPQEILAELHSRMDEESAVDHQRAAIGDDISAVKDLTETVGQGQLVKWARNRRGEWVRQPGRLGAVGIDGLPEHLQSQLWSFIRDNYSDPEYRVLEKPKSDGFENGLSKHPDGALTLSEYALREGTEQGSTKNMVPKPILQAFLDHLDPGKGLSVQELIEELQSHYNHGNEPEPEPVQTPAKKGPSELDTAAARERMEFDKAKNAQKAAADQQAKVESGGESYWEKRARLAAERLAAPPVETEAAPEGGDDTTLFQRSTSLTPEQLDAYRDIAAAELERGRERGKVVQWLNSKYKLSFDDAKAIVRAGERGIRLTKDLQTEEAAAPRIVELHDQGLKSKDIAEKLATEFPEIKATRRQAAWRNALEDAGREPWGSGGTPEQRAASKAERQATKQAKVETATQLATGRIQQLVGMDAGYGEISQTLEHEFPQIPKSQHMAVIAGALRDIGEPVVTRFNKEGDTIVFVGGKSVMVPEKVVGQVSEWVKVKGQLWKTEARVIDRLSNRSADLRDWLVENREHSVAGMTRERAGFKQQLLDSLPIDVKDRAASELVMRYGDFRSRMETIAKMGPEMMEAFKAWRGEPSMLKDMKDGGSSAALSDQMGRRMMASDLDPMRAALDIDDLKKLRPNDWDKIVAADQWFRDRFDDLLKRTNAVRTKYGKDPIPFRQDYYTHGTEVASMWEQVFGNIENRTGGMVQEMAAPEGGGVSAGQRNSPYNPFANRRLGTKTTYDAVGAFERYLGPTLAEIHLTKAAVRRNILARVLENKALEELGTQDQQAQAVNIRNVAYMLKQQARLLTGQKLELDAHFGQYGETIQRFANLLARKAAASSLAGNLRSAVMMGSHAMAGFGELGYTNMIDGAVKGIMDLVQGRSSLLASSDFLTRRYADTSTVRPTVLHSIEHGISIPLEMMERAGAETVWRGAYEKALSDQWIRGGLGMEPAEAMKYADRITERIVAGRAKGEKPVGFESTVGRTVMQFQLQESNLWHYLKEDLKFDNDKLLTKPQIALKVTKIATAVFLFNTIAQQLFNDTPLPDPIRLLGDLFNLGSSKVPLGKKVELMMGHTLGAVAHLLPGANILTSILSEQKIVGTDVSKKEFLGHSPSGTVPMAGMISSWTGADWGANMVRDLLVPFAGRQIQKTTQGADALMGGKLSQEFSKVPVVGHQMQEFSSSHINKPATAESGPKSNFPKPSGVVDTARALAFGPAATSAAAGVREKKEAATIMPHPPGHPRRR